MQTPGSWVEVEDDFVTVMVLVSTCRTNKSPTGVAPYNHRADGKALLVLVRACSPLQYASFLLHLSKVGTLPWTLHPQPAAVAACFTDPQPLRPPNPEAGGLLPVRVDAARARISQTLAPHSSKFPARPGIRSPPTQVGAAAGRFSFVDVVDVLALQLQPLGEQSSWHCDGELLPDNALQARVHGALVDVFARGPDVK